MFYIWYCAIRTLLINSKWPSGIFISDIFLICTFLYFWYIPFYPLERIENFLFFRTSVYISQQKLCLVSLLSFSLPAYRADILLFSHCLFLFFAFRHCYKHYDIPWIIDHEYTIIYHEYHLSPFYTQSVVLSCPEWLVPNFIVIVVLLLPWEHCSTISGKFPITDWSY